MRRPRPDEEVRHDVSGTIPFADCDFICVKCHGPVHLTTGSRGSFVAVCALCGKSVDIPKKRD